MSGVSFLDKLLDGAVVEWKPLGAVLVRTQGMSAATVILRAVAGSINELAYA
jgi:hypothetical protein